MIRYFIQFSMLEKEKSDSRMILRIKEAMCVVKEIKLMKAFVRSITS